MMERISSFIFVVLTLFVLITGTSTASGDYVKFNPATDEEEVVLITDEQEKNMGKRIDEEVWKEYDMPVDPLVEERIEKIGERLAACTERKNIVYHFRVLDHKKDGFYNAFAVPGGYIYIFDDLVNELKDDDKIAGVLAHEMGHVEARHSVKRMQTSLGVTALMILGSQMNTTLGDYSKASKAINEMMADYSRTDERKADELAVKYMMQAGFDPEGAVGAIQTLQRLQKKAPIRKYSTYKSHPYISERVSYLRACIDGRTGFDSYINLSDKNK
ncbi:MAG TPA: M48 family metalloprotease [Candidatus Omnitrophota bacterium]|nr:M48 family metalloprotease [Candidatus Omnitrophota bacterium]HPS20189.1 M48 family metalloprotease [Candidatus Omnitrophota bacterium]